MMLRTQLDWAGSPSAQIGPWWWNREFHPVKRLNGQMAGLGDTCGPDPGPAQVTLMSSPNCSPMDTVCVLLNQQIEEYNNALQINSTKLWERAWCEKQNCQNQGTPGYPRDCNSIYPTVSVPPQPSYPGAQAILQSGGLVTGYGTAPIGSYGGGSATGSTGGYTPPPPPPTPVQTPLHTEEIAQARQVYIDLLSRYGVAANSAVTSLFNTEFEQGLQWYLSTYGSYSGLTNYVRPNADSKVQEWMRKAGVTKADGTATKPATGGSGQGGNVDTGSGSGSGSEGDKSTGTDMLGSNGGMFIALGAVALLMLAGGKH